MLSIRTSAGTRIERGLHEPYRDVLHALKSLVGSEGCGSTKGDIDKRGRRYVCGALKSNTRLPVESVRGKRCSAHCTCQAGVYLQIRR